MNLLKAQRAVFASALTTNEKIVALALLDHWSVESPAPWPTVETLEKWTSLSRCSVMRAIKSLEKQGAITPHRRLGGNSRYTLDGLTGLPQRPVSHSDRSPTATGLPQRPQPVSHSDPKEPKKEPKKEPMEGERAAAPLTPAEIYRTDGAGTRLVDPFAASFQLAGEVERYAFDAWAKAFGKCSTVFDSRRAACLRERVDTGMTKQDADDAIVGALADDWVTGKKTGKRNDRLTSIFGDAERYEEFRDHGRDGRTRPRPLRAGDAAAREAAYQAQMRAEAEARHAELAKEAAANGWNVAALENLPELIGAIGG